MAKKHKGVLHGRCPICGHYGDDCKGTKPRPKKNRTAKKKVTNPRKTRQHKVFSELRAVLRKRGFSDRELSETMRLAKGGKPKPKASKSNRQRKPAKSNPPKMQKKIPTGWIAADAVKISRKNGNVQVLVRRKGRKSSR